MTRDHLHPAARKMLELPQEQRVRALQVDRWIDYPRATEALQRLRRLLETPERERMPCMVLHGPSNIGKTLILRKFLRSSPPSFDATRGVERRTVIAMQMPPTPDQRRFYRALLSAVGAPQGPSSTLASLEQVACDILRRMGPRMLIVDEVHHLLAGSHREQRASLNLLKYLANELKISIVAVGTSDAPVAFHTDAQVASRFTPFELARWTESEDFRRLLSAFEAVLPLKRPSELTQRPIVQYLLVASAGLLGDVSRMLCDAAEQAIADGSEAITLAHLEQIAHANA
jgi:replication-associated recombination protein RarA